MSGAISQEDTTPAPPQIPTVADTDGVPANGAVPPIATNIEALAKEADDDSFSPVSPLVTRKTTGPSTSTSVSTNRKASVQGRRVSTQPSSLSKNNSKTWTPAKSTGPSSVALSRTTSPTFKDIVSRFNQNPEDGQNDDFEPTRIRKTRTSSPMGLRKASDAGNANETSKTTKSVVPRTMPAWKPGGGSGSTGLRQRQSTQRDSRALRSPTSSTAPDPDFKGRRNNVKGNVNNKDVDETGGPSESKKSSPPRGRRDTLAPNSRPPIRSSRSTPPLRSGADFRDERKSSSLAAYINAPSTAKNPPLRSTRPKQPVTSTTKIPMRTETNSGLRNRFAGENEPKSSSKPKKNIPELNSVDFAARRKLIASAFNDKMDKARREEASARAKKAENEKSNEAEKDQGLDTNIESETQDSEDNIKDDAGDMGDSAKEDATSRNTNDDQTHASQPQVKDSDARKQSGGIGLGLMFESDSADKPSIIAEASPVSPLDESGSSKPERRSLATLKESPGSVDQSPSMQASEDIISSYADRDSILSSKSPNLVTSSYNSPAMPLRQSPHVNLNENYQVTTIIVQSPEDMQSPRSALQDVTQVPLRPPPSPPRILEPPPDTAVLNFDVRRRGSSKSKAGSISSRAGSVKLEDTPKISEEDWSKAEAVDQARQMEIERERDLKVKNRHSLPPPPSPTYVSGEFDEAMKHGHKKQASLASTPTLAPPNSSMWGLRPMSTAGESMISSYYNEQEELAETRARKQRIAEGTASAEDMEKEKRRYQLHDNDYTADPPDNEGFANVVETYTYGRESGTALDPNDYWTPVPAQSEFGGRSARQSWMTTDTRDITHHNRVSSTSSRIMDRMRPIGEGPPPTPPPKDVKMHHQKPPPVPPLPNKALYESSNKIETRRSSLPASLGAPSPGFVVPAAYTELKSPNSLAPSENTLDVPFSSTSSNYSEDNSSNGPQAPGESTQMYSVMSPNNSIITGNESFISKDAISQNQKHLIKRRHLLKELLDTEKSFFLDMTVTLEIYKGTTGACEDLKPDDVRAIFGNTEAVVLFSKSFIETIKAAVASVYVPSRTGEKPGPTPSGSRVNSSTVSLVTMGSNNQEVENSFENDDENDRRTWVGEAFGQALPRMEKIYGDYCKNHEVSVAKLQALEKTEGVSMWLKECKEAAEDLTNAWSLESLLIKPVQRIMKYPLLLDQILECTPHDHPDYTAMEVAAKEIKTATERINESKKRKDLMDKIVGSRKRAETDIRHGLTKGLVRRAEKLRQSVGLSEEYRDEKFDEAEQRFKKQYLQVQVVMRDIQMCLTKVEEQVNSFYELANKFEEYAGCLPTKFKDYIVRWRDFTSRAREIRDVALPEHKRRIEAHCVAPLEKVMKMNDHPQKVMAKREKKTVDYARFLAIKEKGDKPDKRIRELADAYTAINDTLLDELPKFHKMTEQLVSVVLGNFSELTALWERNWHAFMIPLLDPLDIPSNFSDIIEVYRGDFKVEPMMQSFTITNSQSKLWQTSAFVTSTTALDTDGVSLYRPPTGMSEHSIGAILPANTPRHEKRLSGGIINSPFIAAIAHGVPSVSAQAAQQQQQQQVGKSRDRSSTSTAHSSISNSSQPPPRPNAVRALSTGTSSIAPARPHTSSGSASVHSGHSSVTSPPLPPLPSQADLDALEPRSTPSTRPNSSAGQGGSGAESLGYKVLWLCASIYAYQASAEANQKRDLGFAYLTYDQGEVFDVIGVKGEYWLAKNQDDDDNVFGWIWSKHFARLAS